MYEMGSPMVQYIKISNGPSPKPVIIRLVLKSRIFYSAANYGADKKNDDGKNIDWSSAVNLAKVLSKKKLNPR